MHVYTFPTLWSLLVAGNCYRSGLLSRWQQWPLPLSCHHEPLMQRLGVPLYWQLTRRSAAREPRTSGEGKTGSGAGTATVGSLTPQQTDGRTELSASARKMEILWPHVRGSRRILGVGHLIVFRYTWCVLQRFANYSTYITVFWIQKALLCRMPYCFHMYT